MLVRSLAKPSRPLVVFRGSLWYCFIDLDLAHVPNMETLELLLACSTAPLLRPLFSSSSIWRTRFLCEHLPNDFRYSRLNTGYSPDLNAYPFSLHCGFLYIQHENSCRYMTDEIPTKTPTDSGLCSVYDDSYWMAVTQNPGISINTFPSSFISVPFSL